MTLLVLALDLIGFSTHSVSLAQFHSPVTCQQTELVGGRCLPTPNSNVSSTSLSVAVAKSPCVSVPDLPPWFCALPMSSLCRHLPPVVYWSKVPVWGALPTHGFRAHIVTPADNVDRIFGGCDNKRYLKDMRCFNIVL